MARRRRNESIFDLLIELPWWVSILFAGAVYAGARYWLPDYLSASGTPIRVGIAQGLRENGWVFAFPFLLMAPISLFRSLHRRRLLDQQRSLDSIRALSWQDFEKLCGEAYRRKGFSVQENGGGGADGGIDLILRRGGETWLIQCKRWKNFKVGVKEIRELYGIMAAEGASRGVFITSGEYTPDARAFAADKPLDLVDGPALLELVQGVQAGPAPVAARPTAHVEPVFSPPPVPEPTTLSTPAAPPCPRCGGSMVLRTARRGANSGGRFWGCSNYPKCRGIVEAG
jgi:restriction system protein